LTFPTVFYHHPLMNDIAKPLQRQVPRAPEAISDPFEHLRFLRYDRETMPGCPPIS
jgi:hypothetical protein